MTRKKASVKFFFTVPGWFVITALTAINTSLVAWALQALLPSLSFGLAFVFALPFVAAIVRFF